MNHHFLTSEPLFRLQNVGNLLFFPLELCFGWKMRRRLVPFHDFTASSSVRSVFRFEDSTDGRVRHWLF